MDHMVQIVFQKIIDNYQYLGSLLDALKEVGYTTEVKSRIIGCMIVLSIELFSIE